MLKFTSSNQSFYDPNVLIKGPNEKKKNSGYESYTRSKHSAFHTQTHTLPPAKRTFQLMLMLMEPSGSETGCPASLLSTRPLYPDTGPDHKQSTSCNHKSRWTWPGEGWLHVSDYMSLKSNTII